MTLGYPPDIMGIFLSLFHATYISLDRTGCADHEYHIGFEIRSTLKKNMSHFPITPQTSFCPLSLYRSIERALEIVSFDAEKNSLLEYIRIRLILALFRLVNAEYHPGWGHVLFTLALLGLKKYRWPWRPREIFILNT